MTDPAEQPFDGEWSQKEGSPRFGYAPLVAIGILLSRLFGLARERVFAHYLGAGDAAGAFKAAFRIPSLLQSLFGEGAVAAAVVPVYAGLLERGEQELAGRVAGAVAAFLALIVAALVIIGVLASPVLVDLLAPGFDGEVRQLTISIVRILFPASGLLVMSIWCMALLNSHRRFFLSYAAPVIWNSVIIAVLVALGARLMNAPLAIAVAWGSVAGAGVQLVVQLPFVLRQSSPIVFALDWTLDPVRTIARRFLPVAVGRGAGHLGAFVDGIIVSFLGAPVLAILNYVHIIYMLPFSLFGGSVAAAELPEMSRVAGDPEPERIRARLVAGLGRISFFVVPSAIAFLILGDVIVAGILETGEFDRSDTIFTWHVLATYSIGLVPMALSSLYAGTFHAIGDTVTPLKVALTRIAIGAGLGYALAFPFRDELFRFLVEVVSIQPVGIEGTAPSMAYGLVGIAAGAAVAGWIEFLLLRRSLKQRTGPLPSGVSRFLLLFAIATIAAVASRYLVSLISGLTSSNPLIVVLFTLSIYGCAYLGAAVLLNVEEANGVLSAARRAVGRR